MAWPSLAQKPSGASVPEVLAFTSNTLSVDIVLVLWAMLLVQAPAPAVILSATSLGLTLVRQSTALNTCGSEGTGHRDRSLFAL